MGAVRKRRSYNLAEAKKRLSELVGRVAYGGERVLISRRGTPMAELVPVAGPEAGRHLADVRGWLADDDPLFASLDAVVAARAAHRPRCVARRAGRARRGGR